MKQKFPYQTLIQDIIDTREKLFYTYLVIKRVFIFLKGAAILTRSSFSIYVGGL